MATDQSSGENGSVSADRITIPTVGAIVSVGPAPNAGLAQGSGPLPAVSAETQAKAEAAARIAAQTLGAPNLTKELAQLLAASIAQSQQTSEGVRTPEPSQGIHGKSPMSQAGSTAGTPTNGELASLSAIMAGTHSVRKPLPRFRDDLATLSYARTQAQLADQASAEAPPARTQSLSHALAQAPSVTSDARPAQPAHTPQMGHYPQAPAGAFDAHHDDEPMPIPSTWREKARHDEERPFSRQLGAALMGLAAGLVVVVPAVLWLAGVIGPQGKRSDAVASRASERPVAKIRPIEPPIDSATFYSNETPGSPAADPGPVTTASMARVTTPFDATQQVEQVLVLSRQKIEGGDVAAARDLLAGEDNGSAAIAFALAETFDPNMLAAWGSRGISADVQRARSLYARALDMGYGRAMARLDALR